MSWAAFSAGAPDLAARVRARFEAHPHHVIATLRRDGRPRASGTNVFVVDDARLCIGCMDGAVKADDLLRDGRYSLHSATLDEQMVGGDAKVSGTAVTLALEHVDALTAAVEAMVGQPPPPGGTYFELSVDEVALAEVHGDTMTITSWSASKGLRTIDRH
jgi:hypothetical protein